MTGNWLDEIEDEVRLVLETCGSLSARDLGRRLCVSEDTAVSFIGLLAASGRLVIERVSLPDTVRNHRAADDSGVLRAAA